MFFTILLYTLAAIGAAVVLFFAHAIAQETIRAVRQSHRIATAHARMQAQRHPSWTTWRRCFWSEFFDSYSCKRIGPYELDFDPTKPARPTR
jgi:hypothetical protein